VVRDFPGFATSRINAMIGNEAFRMLEQGVASADEIDTAIGSAEPPDGAVEMGDLVVSTCGSRSSSTSTPRSARASGRRT